MLKRLMCVAAAWALLSGTPLAAQEEKAQPQKPQEQKAQEKRLGENKPANPVAPQPVGQPVNVRIEIAIADQTGPGQPSTKTITVVGADRENTSIRTNGWIMTPAGRRDVVINVDARPIIMKEGGVRIDLGLQYQPTGGTQGGTDVDRWQTQLNERVSTIVQSGKSTIVSQAADPTSDRKITVELTATILK